MMIPTQRGTGHASRIEWLIQLDPARNPPASTPGRERTTPYMPLPRMPLITEGRPVVYTGLLASDGSVPIHLTEAARHADGGRRGVCRPEASCTTRRRDGLTGWCLITLRVHLEPALVLAALRFLPGTGGVRRPPALVGVDVRFVVGLGQRPNGPISCSGVALSTPAPFVRCGGIGSTRPPLRAGLHQQGNRRGGATPGDPGVGRRATSTVGAENDHDRRQSSRPLGWRG